ncbi:hypothetical protein V8G69_11230 [Gaetbulibacter sp. M235]|uniref:hypothetical protein n=1 Tax=Gaetbulibacter sp. M235 TaxID=3126510 RepID=UPI00374E6815
MKPIENHSKSILIGLCILLFVHLSKIHAQSFENLNHLAGHNTNTYFSKDSKEQAEIMAIRCDSVISFYKSLINFKPSVTLLVLSPADWNKYTNFPVYGMPHYNDSQTLIVASDDNAFWKSFIPPLDKLPSELTQEISNTYSDKNHSLTMRSFFDLLAIHELGHAFHSQGELTMQRKWMGELFANILLHTYIAEKEPELLPALTIFPKMVVSSANKEELKYTTLEQLESNYDVIGQQYPNNYGWYQCRWHMAAGNIYDVGGITAFQNLWQELKSQKNLLDDSALATLLAEKVHQSVADVLLKWNE